jgi:hypothetical protein
LIALGASSHHRSLFIRTFLERGEDPGQTQFDFADDVEPPSLTDVAPESLDQQADGVGDDKDLKNETRIRNLP